MKVLILKKNLKMMIHLPRLAQMPALILTTQILIKEYLVKQKNIILPIQIKSDYEHTTGSMNWVQRQIMGGINPRRLLHQVFGASVPSQLEDSTLWRVSKKNIDVCKLYMIKIIMYYT